MGIFSRRITAAYSPRLPAPPAGRPLSIASPWSPQDTLLTFALDDALAGALSEHVGMTRDIALRIPGVKRAHGIHVGMFAQIPFFRMDGEQRTAEQPSWLTTSASGVAPYHRMFGLGSDLFFHGWGCLGFTADMSDCLHIPFGLWSVLEDGTIEVDERMIPAAYRARPVAIPVGYGENGLLNDGLDTLREARQIEAAYVDRLSNPVPHTILRVPREVYESWTDEERAAYRAHYVEGRKGKNGAVSLALDEFPIEFPDAAANGVDLFESGRNAVRLDIANHTATPASLIEGVKQGGSSGAGTEVRYSGIANGAGRPELWDFGLAKRFTLAFEARMSLDDIVPPGMSIRGDLANLFALPAETTNPLSED